MKQQTMLVKSPPSRAGSCFDFLDNSIKFGVLDRRKKTVFRVVLAIRDVDSKEYLLELARGGPLAITGRIQLDQGVPGVGGMRFGWDWEGGPQIVVTSKSQITPLSAAQNVSDTPKRK